MKDKYVCLSFCLCGLLATACIKASTESNISLIEGKDSATVSPTPPSNSLSSEFSVSKLDLNKAKKIDFGDLPSEIIAHLAQYENRAEYRDASGELQSYPDNSSKWYKHRTVEVVEKDLNQDKTPEKIVITDDSANHDVSPTAYIFMMENGKWKSLHKGGFGYPKKLEFLASGETGKFDVINYGGERPDGEGSTIKFIGLWRIEKGQYERYECREVKKGVESIIPCP
jgi:hypothetical protein